MKAETAVMGLGEPVERETTRWERIASWGAAQRRSFSEGVRTRRWLRVGAIMTILAGVFASGVVYNQRTTAPGEICKCPLKVETPKQGAKKAGGKQ